VIGGQWPAIGIGKIAGRCCIRGDRTLLTQGKGMWAASGSGRSSRCSSPERTRFIITLPGCVVNTIKYTLSYGSNRGKSKTRTLHKSKHAAPGKPNASPDTSPNRSTENQACPRAHVQSPARQGFFRKPDTAHRVGVHSKYSQPCQYCLGLNARSQTQR
jgi:hypothetical protein